MKITRRGLLAATAAAIPLAPCRAQSMGLSQTEAQAGVRQALLLAARAVTGRLGERDGFFGNPRVRIPLPGTLSDAQRALRPFGLSEPLDDLQLRMNRGAEAAMPAALRLFERAIRSVNLSDALAILRGGEDAATRFLRDRTEADLAAALSPLLRAHLASAGAFAGLDAAATRAGFNGASDRLRSEIVDFTTRRALNAAFDLIAEEERALRRDPATRATRLLRRVFAG